MVETRTTHRRGARSLVSQTRDVKSQEDRAIDTPYSAIQESDDTAREPDDNPEIIAAIEKEYEETMDLNQCLRAHHMYSERKIGMPRNLQILISLILVPRQAPPSPKSRKVASANQFTKLMSEIDAMVLLEDFLGYTPQDSLYGHGTKGIIRTHNRQWKAGLIPIPATEHDNVLAATIQAVESPAKPKPDITYGYSSDMFSESEISYAATLPSITRVVDKGPLWPFLIMEWKSDLGQMENGQAQAMRDGTAAVNSIWHLLNETGSARPQEHETAVFCACVGPRTIDIFVSWRCCHPSGELSWELDRIHEALLSQEDQVFHTRSILLNIREWAQSIRLSCIKAALRPSKRTFDFVEDTQNLENERPAKRSKLSTRAGAVRPTQ
ncbi:hypothetical protein MMC17_005559 [Xylographa soralifera]|nr:hypothetical protein [Xylographa soralifera]